MKKQEVFSLVAGALGFIVDAIALAEFLTPVPLSGPDQNASAFPRTWGILLLVYGWFLVSWSLAQWKITRRDNYLASAPGVRETPAYEIVIVIVMVVGLLLLPISFMIVSDFLPNSQGEGWHDLERIVNLIFFSLVSMGLAGFGVFGVTYGLLSIIKDEEGVEL